MKNLTCHIARFIRVPLLLALFLCISGTKLKAQVSIISSPAMVNDTINLCPPNTSATFSVGNAGFGESYLWNFGPGGSLSTGAGPHNVSFSRPVSITLMVSVSGIPTDTVTAFVDFVTLPSLQFSPSKTSFCESDAPYLLNGGSPAGGYYSGPGVSGEYFDPGMAGPGFHDIWYVYEEKGCSDSVMATMEVIASPDPVLNTNGTLTNFNGEDVYARCVPSNSTFIFSTTTPASSYTSFVLDFGDGSVPISGSSFPSPYTAHTYASSGFYTVTLTMTNSLGCATVDSIRIFFGSNPSVGLSIKGNNVKCLPNDSTGITFSFPISDYSSNSKGTVYIVEVNDGSPPVTYIHPPPDSITHTFYEPSCGYSTVNFQNAFQVQIRAMTPCQPPSVATVEPIYISDPPTAAFDAPPRVCLGEVANIHDNSWGSLNALTGCDTNVTLVWEISPGHYNLQSGFLGDRMGSSSASNWLPGSENLAVQFTKPGIYTVNQYVGNQAGCEIDTVTQEICVDSIPEADFALSAQTICRPDTLSMHYLGDLFSLCGTTELTWSISPRRGQSFIGDPGDSAVQIVLNRTGNYTISLRTENHCGNNEQSVQINVIDGPELSLPNDHIQCGTGSVDFGEAPFEIDLSTNGGTASLHWEVIPDTGWSFASGYDSSSGEPIIDFLSYGSYTVVLNASTVCGDVSDTMNLTFAPEPTIEPLPDTLICRGSDFFANLSAHGGTAPYTFSWFIVPEEAGDPLLTGDSTINLNNITSAKTVYISVTDASGCTDNSSFEIAVSDLSADAGPHQLLCEGDSANLNGSVSGGIPAYQYYWSPGENLSDSTILNPVYFGTAISQNLTLTVIDSMGCETTDQVTISFDTSNTVDAGPDQILCYDSPPYDLGDQETSGGNWWGPGVSGGLFDPTAAGLGVHQLFYENQNATGCPFTDSVTFSVISGPVADFGMSGPGCSPLSLSVTDSSNGASSYQWIINDSVWTRNANPVFSFVNYGSQDSVVDIKLIVSASSGCSDSITKSITVYPGPQLDFSLPTVACPQDSIQVSVPAISGSSYQWLVSGKVVEISSDTSTSPWFIFPDNQSGSDSTYEISLIGTTSHGCSDTLTKSISIPSRPIADFEMPAPQCSPASVSPVDLSSGSSLNYSWRTDSGVAITDENTANPVFAFPVSEKDSVTYTIHLLVSDNNGCADSTNVNYTVYPRPNAAFSHAAPDSCGPVSVSFSNLSSANQSGMDRGSMSFFWDFGNGITSTDSTPVVNFTNTGTIDSMYVVELIATNALGCADTTTDTIIVHPLPRSGFSASTQVGCAPFTIDSNLVNVQHLASANAEYIWQILEMDGTVIRQDTGIHSLQHNILHPGDSVMARLIVTSSFACETDTSEELFYTIGRLKADFTPVPQSGCSPLSVSIIDSSTAGADRQWFVDDSLYSTSIKPAFVFTNNSSTKDKVVRLKLVLQTPQGCSDTLEKNVVIHPVPKASFNIPAEACPGDTLQAVNTSSAPSNASYQWSASSKNVWISNDTIAKPVFAFPDNQSGFDSTYTIFLNVSSDSCSDVVKNDVSIAPRPLAAFTLPAPACGEVEVRPADSSKGKDLVYQWSVTPLVKIKKEYSPEPEFTFPVSNQDSVVYQVHLLVTDTASGCSDSLTLPYTVYPKPTAAFTASERNICEAGDISFQNLSSPNQAGMDREGMSFFWDFGNGSTSTDSVPTANFSNSGTTDSSYVVRLIATNAFGCTDTSFDTITVHPAPRAQFTNNTTMGCSPLVIDSSLATVNPFNGINDSYYWQLEDMNGGILDQDTGMHGLRYTLSSSGDSVLVKLITTSPFGCIADTAIQLFYTINDAVANFSPVPESGCSPFTVTIIDSSTAAASQEWFVNDSLYHTGINPSFTFVNNSSVADTSVSIKLVVSTAEGCKDSIEKSITIFPVPAADFSIPAEVCPGDTLYAVNNSIAPAGSDYKWSVSSPAVWVSNDSAASPGFVFPDNQSGSDSIYSIELVVSSGNCTDTLRRDVKIFSRPVALFSMPAPGCGPLVIKPANASSGNNLSYQWGVDSAVDIQGATHHTPTLSFPASQQDSVTYEINLLLTDDVSGCRDRFSATYTVYPQPTAAFAASPDDSCSLNTIAFQNNSSPNQTGMDQGDMSFEWDFGNGQNSTDPDPVMSFANTGIADTVYPVRLIATNAFGCSDTLTDSIVIQPSPKASFSSTISFACAPFRIDSNIINTQVLPYSNDQYYWEVINTSGTIVAQDTGINAIDYNIASDGDTVMLRLTVTSAFNCATDTSLQMFYSLQNPVADFSPVPGNGCSPLNINVIDSSTAGADQKWYVNDSLYHSGTHPSFTFTNNSHLQDSTVIIKLVVSTSPGCADSMERPVAIYPIPAADFSFPAEACPGDTLYSANKSIAPAGATYQWTASSPNVWISDDTSATPGFAFPDNQSGADSIYSISLVINSGHCTDTVTRDVTIFSRPVAAFGTPAPGCGPLVINPADASSGKHLSYQWSVNPTIDIEGATHHTPTFSFPVSMQDSVTYQIHLLLTDSITGCTDSMSLPYTVYPKPTADFTTTGGDFCGSSTLRFTNLSSPNQAGMDRSDMSFFWDFGNGTTSTDSMPSASFINTGTTDTTYVIRLIATNAFGCADTTSDTIIVHPSPQAGFSAVIDIACAPFGIDSSIINTMLLPYPNDQYYYEIINSDGVIVSQDTGIDAINYNLLTDGDTMMLRLTVTSSFGCEADTSLQYFYTHENPVANFAPLPAEGCTPLTVSVSDSSSAGVSKQWFVNDTLYHVGENPLFHFSNEGHITDRSVGIKLLVESGNGCKDSIERSVIVHPQPLADFAMPAISCASDTIYPLNNSQYKPGAVTFEWKAISSQLVILNDSLGNTGVVLPNNRSLFDSTYSIRLIITTADGCTDSITKSFSVQPQPTAAFNIPAASCAPASFGPINLSTGKNRQYSWSVLPSVPITNANGKDPVFNFPLNSDSVEYQVRLIITDSVSGCSDVLVKSFKTYPAPTADFSFPQPDSCGPFVVNFTNLSAPNLAGMDRSDMSFEWDFGNGQTSTDSTPTVTFTNSGLQDSTYQVRLIVSNAYGCRDTLEKAITVFPNPRATASAYPVTGCAPFVIDTTNFNYTDHSFANSWYQWQLIDAKTGSLLKSFNRYDSLHYAIPQPGDSVYLRMIAHSANGCDSDTLQVLFHTSGNEPVGIAASPASGCHPLVSQLSDTAKGFVQWQWYIDGQAASVLKNPTFSFTNTGYTHDSIYNIKLVAWDANGCADSSTYKIRVHAQIELDWHALPSCMGDSMQFVNTSALKDSIAEWVWDFGDGTFDSTVAPQHRYPAPGIYIVSLTGTTINGCAFSHTDTVINRARPQASFGFSSACGSDSACVSQPVNLLDSSVAIASGGQIVQWEWDILANGSIEYTAQNPVHTFNTPGTYPVRLIVTSNFGCKDTIERSIHIYAPPVASFSLDSLWDCGPFVVPISNTTTGVVRNYYWEVFSRNSTGNRVVIFSSANEHPNPLPALTARWGKDTTYYFELTAGNCCGSTSYLDSVTLKPLPLPGLSASTANGCSPLNVSFGLDTLVTGEPDFLVMDYGDGSPIDTLWNWNQVSHSFINSSLQDTIYTVNLTAVNECADSSLSMRILVRPDSIQAAMEVTPTSGCSPLSVQVTDISTGSYNTSWCLDYNPANGSCNMPIYTGDTILHTYTTPGTYVIAQFVNNQCSYDTAYTSIQVYPTPQAAFAYSGDICQGADIQFTDQTVGDTIASYQWDFGDGNHSNAIDPVHHYALPGTYVVCLEVTSNRGCYSIYCDTVQIFDNPRMDFSSENACLNEQPISFFDSSSVQQGSFMSTLWKFGDGQTSVSTNPTHTYESAGQYQVTLIHSTTNGCTDSITKTVNIFPTPVADFEANLASAKTCGESQLYDFHNLSQEAQGYYWDFDYNGQRGISTSTQMNTNHLYDEPGVYDVLLVATNSYGCSDSILKQVLVRPEPEADFTVTPDEGCSPLTVTFADNSIYDFDGPGGIVSRTWNFGDGNSITTGDSVVTHTYSEPGLYSVSLIVETDAGCQDSIYMENIIEVLPTPLADFTSTNVASNKVQFHNLSTQTDASTTYYWDFGDGNISYEKDPVHSYRVDLFEKDYSYEVCLITSNNLGCGDTLCQPVVLKGYLLHVPNAFAPDLVGVADANVFLPKGHSIEEYHLSIYDEWGNLIFESSALDEGIPKESWDGKHMKNGTELPMGSYVWKIEATFNDGTIWPGKQYENSTRKNFGTVTLIR